MKLSLLAADEAELGRAVETWARYLTYQIRNREFNQGFIGKQAMQNEVENCSSWWFFGKMKSAWGFPSQTWSPFVPGEKGLKEWKQCQLWLVVLFGLARKGNSLLGQGQVNMTLTWQTWAK